MVLADDNFVSIAEAVREGRRVYDNLIKAIVFTLPTSLGQALVIIIAVLFFPVGSEGLLHPILPIHILWINLVVAVGLSLPLAFETEEENIMKRAPRKKNSSILNPFLIVRTLTIASLMALITIVLFHFEFAKEIGVGKSRLASLTEAQTTAVTAIMLFQVVYLFNCRTLKGSKVMKGFFSNKVLFLSVALVLFLQLAFVYLPFMNQIFRSTPLDLESWVISSLASVTVIVLLRVEDWIGRILQIFKR
jgi:Ca2+-transporting ATPase